MDGLLSIMAPCYQPVDKKSQQMVCFHQVLRIQFLLLNQERSIGIILRKPVIDKLKLKLAKMGHKYLC